MDKKLLAMGLRKSSTAQCSLKLLFLPTSAMPCIASVLQIAPAAVRQWLRNALPIDRDTNP